MPEIAAYLRIRSAHSPQWLDGGGRLAFLSDITGIPQIWLMPATGGWRPTIAVLAIGAEVRVKRIEDEAIKG